MKSFVRGDPPSRARRNCRMFTAPDMVVNDSVVAPPHGLLPVRRGGLQRHVVRTDVTDTDKRLEWVAQIAAVRDRQDQAAFAALFRHFAPRVKGFLMKSGAPADQAEEVAQDVMATVWRKAGMFDPGKASVATWIYTIARNRRIDTLRKSRRPEPEELPWGPEEAASASDIMALQQDTEQLGRALKALPDAQRALIERAYFGELSQSEIALETGLPLGTIKSRIRLALEKLRQSMG
jgi:RNA polymerase sigma factor (sigma-70 family)